MRNSVKFLGIIALVAVMGFSFAACGGGGGGGGGGGKKWTAVKTTSFDDTEISGVAYGGGKWVAVGYEYWQTNYAPNPSVRVSKMAYCDE
jgi:hypothetical protein